jgi:hypothetical protein
MPMFDVSLRWCGVPIVLWQITGYSYMEADLSEGIADDVVCAVV